MWNKTSMLVAIYSSQPQSGKSEVAQVFLDAGFERLSFADAVKNSLLVVLQGLGTLEPESYLWDERKDQIIPQLGVTGGYLMSSYATNFFREIDEDVWLRIVKLQYIPSKRYVLDDLRFANEYKWIKEVSGYLIRVESKAKEHGRILESEGNLDEFTFDVIIENSGTLAELRSKAKIVLGCIT